MSASLNKVCLLGNLGRDPEVRSTQDGRKIVTLSIATSESWKDKNTGETREKTEWHKVVIFNQKIGEIAERYLSKGSQVYIEGALQTRKWTDQAGVERYSTETVLQEYRGELKMLSRGNGVGSGDRQDDAEAPATRERPAMERVGGASRRDELDDEIPF